MSTTYYAYGEKYFCRGMEESRDKLEMVHAI
jgi:hypothetical protein